MNGTWMLIYIKNAKFEVFYIVLFLNKFSYLEKIYDIKKTFLTALGSSSELHPFTIAGAIRLAAKIPRGLATNQR